MIQKEQEVVILNSIIVVKNLITEIVTHHQDIITDEMIETVHMIDQASTEEEKNTRKDTDEDDFSLVKL